MTFHEKLYRKYGKDWVGARKLIRDEMRITDDDGHWLMTKMAQTYNGEKQYSRGLAWAQRALRIAPHCPAARWEQAYALCSLRRHAEAVRVVRALIRRPEASYMDAGDCSKPKGWIRTFITDCYYMLAWEEWLRGRHADALKAMIQHVRRREKGSRTELGDSLRQTRAGIVTARGIIREERRRGRPETVAKPNRGSSSSARATSRKPK